MKHTLTCLGMAALGALTLAATEPEQHKTTIFMIGDSTMANKNLDGGNQERGWGHVLSAFFTDDVEISNHAKNGRSSKSFIDEGLWNTVYKGMQKGDYLIIQFGHNDEKPKPDRHTDPGSTFDANLKLFIDGAREKGATPILCNSIVRRNFAKVKDAVGQDDNAGQTEQLEAEGDSLIETHGDYIVAPRNVAQNEDVIFIDMNKLSHDLVQNLGPIDSRKLFVWAEPKTVAAYPDGKKDNTHLNVHGAHVIARLAAQELKDKVPALAPYIRFYDITVATDGSGDFFTIQEAINAVPDYCNNRRTTIMVNGGTYHEKVVIPESKKNITLIGQRDAKVTWDNFSGKENGFGEKLSTSGSSTFYVYGGGFECQGMTFENSAGRVGQAVACFVKSSGAKFTKCRFLGNQDTLYTYGENDHQEYSECYIEGTVDFIFGKASAYFDRCEIVSTGNGYVCAPATPENQTFGYVFNECKLTKAGDAEKVYLGRPWRPYAKAVFINCDMDSHIVSDGWNNWGKESNEKTAYFGEYGSKGDGASSSRVKWAKKIKSPDSYSLDNFRKDAESTTTK